MNYKLMCYIKNDKYILNDIKDIINLLEPPISRISKIFIGDYVLDYYNDIIDKPKDLKRISIIKDENILCDIFY